MKNSHIKNLLSPVPPEIRLEVYKEAKERIEKDEPVNYDIFALCLMLPCLLWGDEDVDVKCPDRSEWYSVETPIAFPEIKDYIFKLNSLSESNCRDIKNPIRLQCLNEAITKLEKELNK